MRWCAKNDKYEVCMKVIYSAVKCLYDLTEYLPNVTIQLVFKAIVSIFSGLTNVVPYFEVPDGCVYFDYSGSVPPQEVPPPSP